MARKSLTANFDTTLAVLRAHSFDVVPFDRVAGGMLVSKQGAAAVLVAGRETPVAFAVNPGILVGREVARLMDRGYQKFIRSSQIEVPATADQLHALHRFSEELKLLAGTISFYNDSLGTTSDLYQYDRLRGREAAVPSADQTSGH